MSMFVLESIRNIIEAKYPTEAQDILDGFSAVKFNDDIADFNTLIEYQTLDAKKLAEHFITTYYTAVSKRKIEHTKANIGTFVFRLLYVFLKRGGKVELTTTNQTGKKCLGYNLKQMENTPNVKLLQDFLKDCMLMGIKATGKGSMGNEYITLPRVSSIFPVATYSVMKGQNIRPKHEVHIHHPEFLWFNAAPSLVPRNAWTPRMENIFLCTAACFSVLIKKRKESLETIVNFIRVAHKSDFVTVEEREEFWVAGDFKKYLDENQTAKMYPVAGSAGELYDQLKLDNVVMFK